MAPPDTAPIQHPYSTHTAPSIQHLLVYSIDTAPTQQLPIRPCGLISAPIRPHKALIRHPADSAVSEGAGWVRYECFVRPNGCRMRPPRGRIGSCCVGAVSILYKCCIEGAVWVY